VERIPIGEAARRLGMRTSTLRYYEERGLVRPAARIGGKRYYGPAELRRLTFIQIAQRLGIRLDTARAVLDDPDERWRATVSERIAELDALINRALQAKGFLSHALTCPAEHPVRECPYLIEMLDRLLDGVPFDQLAREHAASS
jgi:DNA-binding transcriptional MerR regulator